MEETVPSQQEMFDRAVRGLAGQGWKKAMQPSGTICLYNAPDGCRCAWGHVDPDGTKNLDYAAGSVVSLRQRNIGLAGKLSDSDFTFAVRLQKAHDIALTAASPRTVRENMQELGEQYKLTWPADVA